jgi:tRNA threonylcarbamoyladenosine biosynthesis protein TsaE
MREPGRLMRPLADEAATAAAGAALAGALTAVDPDTLFVTLSGELGAGKTTLARGLLRALGVTGPVRSPTYTLIESYAVGGRRLEHLDWYRLADAEELEALGFRDLLSPGRWVLVEWPERVPAVAASADLEILLRYAGAERAVEAVARTEGGAAVLAHWMQTAL